MHSATPFDQLHHILQIVMGWENTHLYEFRIGRISVVPEDEGNWGPQENEYAPHREFLGTLATGDKPRLTYLYDFGDDWTHEVIVEKKFKPEEVTFDVPICVDGENSCPPEDCGGEPGFLQLLDDVKNGSAKRKKELREWLGRDFDPTRFDVKGVNKELLAHKKRCGTAWGKSSEKTR